MKFIKKYVDDLKQKVSDLNEEQKWQSFAFVWNGIPLPNNKATRKIRGLLKKFNLATFQPLGKHYAYIYELIQEYPVNQDKLKKELSAFYSKPVNEEQKKYYPEYKQKVLDLNTQWLTQICLPDIKKCEEMQKNRLMQKLGWKDKQELQLTIKGPNATIKPKK